jgi:hypothetical protein
MAKELMEIGGFITEGAEIVNHDNTLSGNGTVDSPLGVVPGYNETVLWSGDEAITTSHTISLSEDVKNFDTIRILFRNNDGYRNSTEVIPPPSTGNNLLAGLSVVTPLSNGYAYLKSLSVWISSDGKTLSTPTNSQQLRWPVSGSSVTFTVGQSDQNIIIQRVIGINRK